MFRDLKIIMNFKLHTTTIAAQIAALGTVLCVSPTYAENVDQLVDQSLVDQSRYFDSAAGVAAGTEYHLLGTNSLSFGPGVQSEVRTELLFKLSSDVEVDDKTGSAGAEKTRKWSGDLAFDRIDFLRPGELRLYDLTDGFSYSASIDIASSEEFNSQSEIVSSRQLGIHYGRLGPENYNSIDLSFRQLNPDERRKTTDDRELWSLGVTTGRRFALTGLDSSDPLWTVSLRGQINLNDNEDIDSASDSQQWYVSPGLQWRGDSFRLTADVLMPFMQSGELEDESDYRIRAKIQKRF